MTIKNLPILIEDLSTLKHFHDVKYSGNESTLVWHESINGIGSIYSITEDENQICLSGALDVRGKVGYGGGEFDVGKSLLVFSEKSGALYRTYLKKPNESSRITPFFEATASPVLSADEKWTLFVFHDRGVDGIAVTQTSGLIWPIQLALGADFYMQPVWHPSGEMIAWTEWNHPHMPWDASRVKIGVLSGMLFRLHEESWIAGGYGFAASQPQFSQDGKWLSYIIRNSNWDDLVIYNLKTKKHKTLIRGKEFHLRPPEWVQGVRSYGWDPSSSWIYHFRYSRGKTTLRKTDIRTGKESHLEIEPILWARQISVSKTSESIAFIGSAPAIPDRICEYPNEGQPQFHESVPVFPDIGPQEITRDMGNNLKVSGYYYPPWNSSGTSQPLGCIVYIHSGPTSSSNLGFSENAQYFTSRGFAFVVINYRGSTGFGYEFQEALRHHWGIVDVEDVTAFVQYLIERGLAVPQKIAIMGSSAGGFTVLNSLIQHPGLFKAGICSYGVSDLVEDAMYTHKFEKYYHRFLIGDLELDHQRFLDRSPIHHIDKIKDPLLLFHGADDKVVSPTQSEQIYKELIDQGTPVQLIIYPGEEHGFKNLETSKNYYREIENFLARHL